MDHRLAFSTLIVLLIATGTPLAFAWARLLPEDAPPFRVEPGSFPSVDHEAPQEESSGTKDHLIAGPVDAVDGDQLRWQEMLELEHDNLNRALVWQLAHATQWLRVIGSSSLFAE